MATILVVDDNAENRALAQAALEDEGYVVSLASDGAAALAAFAHTPPDCVLLDVRMPGMDGPAVCEQMRAAPAGRDVPIVFVTAQRDLETFDRAVRAGGDDFLTKPYRPSDLVARVEAALKLRRLAVERSELYAQVKQQREELQRVQLQKEQLTAFLVHDLKNPVHAIDLHAQALLRDPAAAPKVQRAAARIRDEGRALIRRITALLDIAKADEGRLVPAREPIDWAALIASVLADLEVRAQACEVSLAAAPAALVVTADRELLRRVLENLVENAIRHAPEGTSVTVSAVAAAGAVEIRVRDGGPGVPAELRARVFERFLQGGERAHGNRGLGLAFCQLAVEAHGGAIWIEDAAPGAVFCVRIPDGP